VISGWQRQLIRSCLRGDRRAQAHLGFALWKKLRRGRADVWPLPLGGGGMDPGDLDPGAWLERFDTPDDRALAAIGADGAAPLDVHVHIWFTAATLSWFEETWTALQRSAGVRWHVSFNFAADCPERDPVRRRAQALATQPASGESSSAREFPHILVPGGVLLRPHGLRLLAEPLLANRALRLVYADELRIDASGRCHDHWCKPAYDPLLAAQGRLLGGVLAVRDWSPPAHGEVMGAVGVLSACLRPGEVLHLPHVPALDARRYAGEETRAPSLAAGTALPFVSILIPTRDQWPLLRACLASIEQSDWPLELLEIIVVDNGSSDAAALEGLASLAAAGRLRLLHDPGSFNYARLNNLAAAEARGEVLILLNNDTEVLDRQWIRRLAGQACSPGIGAVGAKLLYPDRTVQHGGVVLGLRGAAMHAHVGLASTAPGYRGLACATRSVSAVTGACLAVTRSNYLSAGGLDESCRVSFNDILLCLRLQAQGLRNVIDAEAVLIHHESKSRGLDRTAAQLTEAMREAAQAWRTMRQAMADDPWYSPCLSLETAYRLTTAPRRRPAWRHWAPGPRRLLLLTGVHHRHGSRYARQMRSLAVGARRDGWDVTVGGIWRPDTAGFDGCRCLELHDGRMAAQAASELDVELVVVASAPFYGVARWTGHGRRTLALLRAECPADPANSATDLWSAQAALELAMFDASAVLPAGPGEEGAYQALAAFLAAPR
jgi:GT2 family glycosyltransferase